MAVILYKWLLVFSLGIITLPTKNFNDASSTLSARVMHPFYVSVVELSHNAKDKTLEVSCKIFVDDMEAVLKQNYNTPVDLNNDKQQVQNDKFISDYITRHLALSINAKGTRFNYIGFEKESESVYCYFEIANVPSIKKLDVVNSILQDYTDKQINIMHITVNGNRKSYKLDYPNKQASFSF